jgi:hypothetical protein
MAPRSQKVISIKKTAVVAAGLLVMLGGGMATAQASNDGLHQSWVCKYVGAPGVDEPLKHGKQPIIVDTSATVGTWFKDGQQSSFVLALATEGNTGRGERYKGDLKCPVPGTPPPETTTTTSPSETTTTTPQGQQSWVCKYVGTPGVDERLKRGKQPILVDTSATVGSWFKDGQHRSFVLALATEGNTGPGETYKGNLECPVTTIPPTTIPPTTIPPTTIPPTTPPAAAESVQVLGVSETAPEVAGASQSLAFTGATGILPMGIVGLFALVLGGVLTVAARRRVRS